MSNFLLSLPSWAWVLIAGGIFVLALVIACSGGAFGLEWDRSRKARVYGKWHGVVGLIRAWRADAQRRRGSRTPGE